MSFRNISSQLVRLIKPDATDENWKYYGEKSAYFGVVTWPQFRPENLNDATKAEFFRTGQQYIDRIMGVVEGATGMGPGFRPVKAVDFGCGVGRLVIPLAGRCTSVAGIDVSTAMLEEARRNCEQQKITNVTFHESIDELVRTGEVVDFIHSFIVFQHIRPERGYEIFEKLISLLGEGGVGAIHLTYCDTGGRRARLMQLLCRKIPLLWAFKNLLAGRRFSEPMMDMAEYSLNKIFRILQESGCDVCRVLFSRHGTLGVILVFKKTKTEPF